MPTIHKKQNVRRSRAAAKRRQRKRTELQGKNAMVYAWLFFGVGLVLFVPAFLVNIQDPEAPPYGWEPFHRADDLWQIPAAFTLIWAFCALCLYVGMRRSRARWLRQR